MAPPVNQLTAKQEAFALAYVETGNAAEAYRRAYDVAQDAKDSWIYVEASQLLDNPKVSIRVGELQEQARKLSFFTVQQAFEEYEAARLLAHSEANPSAAVSAVTGKVKLYGLDQPRRVELTGRNGKPMQTEDVTGADKLKSFIAAQRKRIGIAGEDEPSGE